MGSLHRTERSATAAEPRIMIRFSERNEDVNFKGSQFSAEALWRCWRLLLLFEGFRSPPRLHV